MSYDNLFHGDVDTPNHSQWRIKAENLLADRDIFHATATKYFPLGAIAESRDGRKWRYCENGAVALTLALANQSAVGTANWQNEGQDNTPTAPTAGDKTVTVVCASTAAAHDFIDGYLTVEDETGESNMYLIKDNKAGTANATSGYDIVVEIADTGGIRTAWTAASGELTLTKNKYKDTVVFPTDPTGVCVGVNHVAVPANYFYWAQVTGPCPVIVDSTDTIVVGDMVAVGANTAGQACLMDVAADGDRLLGYVMRAAGAAETAIIDLCIE